MLRGLLCKEEAMRVKRSGLPTDGKGGANYAFESARSLRDVSTTQPVRRVDIPIDDYGQLRHDLEKFFRRLGRAYDPAE